MRETLALALVGHGLINLPYEPNIDANIQQLMNSWKKFCSQEQKHKEQFSFGITGGYEFKDKNQRDYKENFHISLGYIPPDCNLSEIDRALFLSAKGVINLVTPIVMEIAEIIGSKSMFDLPKIVQESKEKWTLRLLHYPSRNGKITAASHVDKGITIHLDEDAEGLEVLWNGVWTKAHPMHHHVLAYPGMLGQYYSGSHFPALCHRVETTHEVGRRGRNSIVMFIDFGDVVYDKKTHGPTQDVFPAGENYGVSFDEFSKYFTPIQKQIL